MRSISSALTTLGATVKGEVPDVGGGAFGMARLAQVLSERLQPSQGRRPGRPSDPSWVLQGKVPMSEETKERLAALADKLSSEGRRVSPMQGQARGALVKVGLQTPDTGDLNLSVRFTH